MTGASSARSRIAWLDLARAVSILLVVLYHVGAGAGHALLPPEQSAAGTWWAAANRMLVPIRMPLFFLVAGMLAVGAARRAWPLVLRPRILDFLWPYLLWSVLFALTAWVRYSPGDPDTFLWEQVKATATVMGPYWFIAVLPVFFVVARLGRDRPRALLAVGIVTYLGSWPLRQVLLGIEPIPDLAAQGLYRFTEFAIWYIAGFVLRDQILAVASRAGLVAAAGGVTIFVVSVLTLYGGENGTLVDRMLQAAATLSGLFGAIALLPRLAEIPALRRAGSALGSRTLAIYLVHPLAVAAVVATYPGSALGRMLGGSLVTDLLLVPAVTALGVGIAVMVHEGVHRWGPRWLLAAPGSSSATRSVRAAGR
jgi:uncharacterized membrane protein YcfT